jgi:hypothetical protein
MQFLLAKNPHMDFYVKKLSNLDLGELSLHRARPLLLDRVNSLLSLLLNVFLKVVRRLNYNLVYNDERWQYRRIGNLIHRLRRDNYETLGRRTSDERSSDVRTQNLFTGDYATDVGENIRRVAEAASDFGTTLWFTPEDELGGTLDKLVATGQFTMCYNLIEYLENLLYDAGESESEALAPETRAGLQSLLQQCAAHWAQFKIDPFFMLKIFDKAGKTPFFRVD